MIFKTYDKHIPDNVYVGFDMPRTLGARDTGSNVAAPIFKTFMEKA